MARYILADDVALRSWWRVPYGCITRGGLRARGARQAEFEVLLRCDGQTEVEDCDALQVVLDEGLCRRLGEDERAELADWQRHRSYQNRYMPMMNWEITARCTYNCIHCFNAVDEGRLRDEFTLDEAMRLLDEARDCGVLAFTITGGEPLLHPHFLDIVRGIYNRGMGVFELNTNGALLTQGLIDEMASVGCAPLMKISFDGLGFHDWMRGRAGAQDDALAAMRLCVDNGLCVKAQVNFNKRNIDCIPETLHLLDSMGVTEARIIRTTPTPRWNRQGTGLTFDDRELFDHTLRLACDYARGEHVMSLDFWHTLRLFPWDKSYVVDMFGSAPDRFRGTLPICRGNRGMMAVGANGNVYPCMQMSGTFESRDMFLGNVKRTGLRPLLQSGDYLKAICATVDEKCAANGVCGGCRHLRYCTGGCPAMGISSDPAAYPGLAVGEYLSPDPLKCLFFNEGFYFRYTDALSGELGWRNRAPVEVVR